MRVVFRRSVAVVEAQRFRGYIKVVLWTFSELSAAIAIYRKFGFIKTEEKAHYIWGKNLIEEKYELQLSSVR